jgi:hypothetical protein
MQFGQHRYDANQHFFAGFNSIQRGQSFGHRGKANHDGTGPRVLAFPRDLMAKIDRLIAQVVVGAGVAPPQLRLFYTLAFEASPGHHDLKDDSSPIRLSAGRIFDRLRRPTDPRPQRLVLSWSLLESNDWMIWSPLSLHLITNF